MKSLTALLTAALLCTGAAACGSMSKGAISTSRASANAAASGDARTTATPSTAPARSYLKNDADDDGDDNPIRATENDDALFLTTYGKEADQADRRAVTALVKRYYAAAATGDGADACPLLYSSLATGLTEGQGQSVPSGSNTCAAVVSLLLEQQREPLRADEVATMVVVDVRVKGTLGLAALGFRTAPMSTILVKRDRGAWKIDALFDSEMT